MFQNMSHHPKSFPAKILVTFKSFQVLRFGVPQRFFPMKKIEKIRSSDLNKALIQEGGKRCRASRRLLSRTCQTSNDLFVKDFMTPFIKDFKIHLFTF